MCILTYVSTLAVTLFTLWFPVPCSAQIAVPLTTSLPLEVRSPYLNFWTHPSNTRGNTTTSAEVFAKAVCHVNFLLLASYVLVDSMRFLCISYLDAPLYFELMVSHIQFLDNSPSPTGRTSPGRTLLLLAPFLRWT
jgi:hypothetical protein